MTAAMVIVMVFMLVSGHGFGGSHERDANRPAAGSVPHMQHDEVGKPEDRP